MHRPLSSVHNAEIPGSLHCNLILCYRSDTSLSIRSMNCSVRSRTLSISSGRGAGLNEYWLSSASFASAKRAIAIGRRVSLRKRMCRDTARGSSGSSPGCRPQKERIGRRGTMRSRGRSSPAGWCRWPRTAVPRQGRHGRGRSTGMPSRMRAPRSGVSRRQSSRQAVAKSTPPMVTCPVVKAV